MVFGNWMQVPTQRYGEMSGKLDNWGIGTFESSVLTRRSRTCSARSSR